MAVDELDSYDALHHFVEIVGQAGSAVFIIHARKAWLTGLNPKENRTVPPLRHDRVVALKQDFPQFTIITNGGIKTAGEARQHLAKVDGVMIGRAAYGNPLMLVDIDREIFNTSSSPTRQAIVAKYMPYMETQYAKGAPLGKLLKPLLGLFYGAVGGRRIRGLLTSGSRGDPRIIFKQLSKLIV